MSGEVVTIFDELKGYIREALWDMNGVSADGNGGFYTEGFKDYRDELEDSQISDVLAGRYRYEINGEEHIDYMEPKAVLARLVEDMYFESYLECRHNIVNELMENTDIFRILDTLSSAEFDIEDYLEEIWDFRYPVDDFLKQDVCMDIMLDTGDCNYEFTCNNLVSNDIESVEDFDNDSSLLWLCEQQGVTREELLAAFDKGTAHSNEVTVLRQRNNELVEELKKYGYAAPIFNRSAHHTGAYKEYLELKDVVFRFQHNAAALQAKIADNSLSYEEYKNKYFELHHKKAPLTEAQFDVEKAKVLESLSSRLETAENMVKDAQSRLDGNADYIKVGRLYDMHSSVVRQLSELSKTDEYKKAEFINSVHNECLNTYGSSAVTFLVKMSLDEAINMQNVIDNEKEVNNSYCYEDRKGLSSFILDKGVRCGLMDDCSGKGSVFEIKLIKDVEIPVKALYKAVPDRENGNYGFMEIYGENDESFEKTLKEIREVERPKINDLIADAANRVEESSSPGKEKNLEI